MTRATNEEIARKMTQHQLRGGAIIRTMVDDSLAAALAKWANETNYGVLQHARRCATMDTSFTAIARHQQ